MDNEELIYEFSRIYDELLDSHYFPPTTEYWEQQIVKCKEKKETGEHIHSYYDLLIGCMEDVEKKIVSRPRSFWEIVLSRIM